VGEVVREVVFDSGAHESMVPPTRLPGVEGVDVERENEGATFSPVHSISNLQSAICNVEFDTNIEAHQSV
jgi:hypothetical protein